MSKKTTIVCAMPLPKVVNCPYCKGKGVSEWYYSRNEPIPCGNCSGTGKMREDEAERRVHNDKRDKASREAARRIRSFP